MQKLKNRPLCAIVISTILLTSCTTASKNISASYVSPLIYNDMSCRQVKQELGRVTRKVQQVAGVQDAEANKDNWAMGIGLVLFWPSLFFLMGEDKKEELAHLKGEYEALEQVAIQKDCGYVKELQESKKNREEAEAKKKAEKLETRKKQQYN